MSLNPERWTEETFKYFINSLQDGLKKQFDEEAFSEVRDYEKLAHIGNLLANESFVDELKEAATLASSEINKLLEKYSVKDTIIDTSVTNIPLSTPYQKEPQTEIEVKIPPKSPSDKPHTKVLLPVPRPIPKVNIQLIKPIDIPSELQASSPAFEELVKTNNPPLMLIAALQGCRSIIAKEDIFRIALSQLGIARLNREISQSKFNTRFKTLLTLDPSRDDGKNPSYEIIRQILENWFDSNNPNEARLAKNLYAVISTTSLEKMLAKADIEHCEPKRIVSYLRDAAYLVKENFSFETTEDGDYGEIEQVHDPEKLDYVLEIILDRSETELDLIDDIITQMRKQEYLRIPGTNRAKFNYVQDAIETLARNGSESAEAFLHLAWA